VVCSSHIVPHLPRQGAFATKKSPDPVSPFIALQITGLLLVMFFPQIALWLPALLHG
jgi:TRAP-type C4-dicarboxylate transport system permease large subunit